MKGISIMLVWSELYSNLFIAKEWFFKWGMWPRGLLIFIFIFISLNWVRCLGVVWWCMLTRIFQLNVAYLGTTRYTKSIYAVHACYKSSQLFTIYIFQYLCMEVPVMIFSGQKKESGIKNEKQENTTPCLWYYRKETVFKNKCVWQFSNVD